ncbi:hypothetical protein H5410_054015 [Solanum commersonii]|uniref:Uncharacterized protein n=1 Tax=Solanum commersonii TaxID=4109 RepID=A0A9J5X824_SOLCO|nr:hypothetical protein H5410_054015 [Solanum commersonii]
MSYYVLLSVSRIDENDVNESGSFCPAPTGVRYAYTPPSSNPTRVVIGMEVQAFKISLIS